MKENFNTLIAFLKHYSLFKKEALHKTIGRLFTYLQVVEVFWNFVAQELSSYFKDWKRFMFRESSNYFGDGNPGL